MKERIEREGKTVPDNARLKQAAARNNRRSKKFDPDLMRTRALEMDVRHGYQAQRLVAQARDRLPFQLSPYEINVRAREAVIFAREKAVEKDAVADMRKVIGDALRRNLGLTTCEAVMTELQRTDADARHVHKDHAPAAPTRNHYRAHVGDGKGKYSDHDRRQRQPSGDG